MVNICTDFNLSGTKLHQMNINKLLKNENERHVAAKH